MDFKKASALLIFNLIRRVWYNLFIDFKTVIITKTKTSRFSVTVSKGNTKYNSNKHRFLDIICDFQIGVYIGINNRPAQVKPKWKFL